MKMRWYLSVGALTCFSALFASTPVDEELFVSPCLTDLAGKVAFDAGTQLAAEKKQTYDQAFSINVGKNLPSTTHVLSNEACYVVGLGSHIRQMAESLKNEGKGYVVTPASYGVVFTDLNANADNVKKHIAEVVGKIGSSQVSELIAKSLGELKEVLRATFMCREGKLQLVTDEKKLTLGEKLWRKTPTGVVEECYHSEEEYLVAFRQAGLICEEVKRPCFFGEVKWQAYNGSRKEGETKLGAAYVDHNPFTVFVVKKKA